MKKVHALFGGPTPLEPVPEVVDELKLLLKEAKSGVLRGFAYAGATTKAGGAMRTGWKYADGHEYVLSAAMLTLHARFGIALASGDEISDQKPESA
jgi:hypothetical protein